MIEKPHARLMPWKTTCPMDERVKFIAAYLRGELAVSRLCDAFGVSRKTAYKWIGRYAEGGVGELVERLRRPHSHPNAMGPEVESLMSPPGRHTRLGDRRSCLRYYAAAIRG